MFSKRYCIHEKALVFFPLVSKISLTIESNRQHLYWSCYSNCVALHIFCLFVISPLSFRMSIKWWVIISAISVSVYASRENIILLFLENRSYFLNKEIELSVLKNKAKTSISSVSIWFPLGCLLHSLESWSSPLHT